jgi:hypothetical protein
MSVYEAINRVMEDVRSVGKNDRNEQQKFNFRGIDATVNALSPAMRKHGLTVRPSNILSIEHIPFTSKSGALGVSCRVLVEYTFSDKEGDSCTSVVAAEANDYGDKATPKAMSVAFRTCLLQSFALPTDEVDPDAESYDHGQQAPATAVTPPRTIQRQTVNLDEWKAKIEACESVEELRALHKSASTSGAPDSVLSLIAAAGQAKAA